MILYQPLSTIWNILYAWQRCGNFDLKKLTDARTYSFAIWYISVDCKLKDDLDSADLYSFCYRPELRRKHKISQLYQKILFIQFWLYLSKKLILTCTECKPQPHCHNDLKVSLCYYKLPNSAKAQNWLAMPDKKVWRRSMVAMAQVNDKILLVGCFKWATDHFSIFERLPENSLNVFQSFFERCQDVLVKTGLYKNLNWMLR